MKDDVEKSLPPREETMIEVELTKIQKKYYKAIYEKNIEVLSQEIKGNVMPLMNIAMQLRKCCIHPFLLDGVEETETTESTSNHDIMQNLIQSSGKFVLLDKLLPKLKQQGHRLLIFSQMVRVLDILEDFLIYRGYKYERFDGRIRGNLRFFFLLLLYMYLDS